MTQRHEANDYSISKAINHLLVCCVRSGVEQIESERATSGHEAGPGLLTRQQAAEYLSVSLSTFDEVCKSGRIQTICIDNNPRMPRFRRIDLDKYIRSLKPKPR